MQYLGLCSNNLYMKGSTEDVTNHHSIAPEYPHALVLCVAENCRCTFSTRSCVPYCWHWCWAIHFGFQEVSSFSEFNRHLNPRAYRPISLWDNPAVRVVTCVLANPTALSIDQLKKGRWLSHVVSSMLQLGTPQLCNPPVTLCDWPRTTPCTGPH